MEEWRSIPGLEGYEASSFGRIRSLDRIREFIGRWGVPWRRRHTGKVLSLKRKNNGFGGIYLCFYSDGASYPHVNRAVCAAFHGPAPGPEYEAAHMDRDTLNNAPGNLVWATPVENAAHKIGHGTAPVGEKNGCARLRDSDIGPIFDRFLAGELTASIGATLGVSAPAVAAVLRRQTWRHVHVEPEKTAAARVQSAANILAASTRSNARRAASAASRQPESIHG